MTNTDSADIGVDLEALDAFLLSDRSPENSMGLSDLDGFLTAIVIGPEVLAPGEWLPPIWGGDEPVFADSAEAQTILGTILGRYNQIAAGMDAEPLRFDPLFWIAREGHVIVTDWAAGFLDAVKLRAKAWDPLITHPEARSMIIPMFLMGAEDGDDLPLGQRLLSDGDLDKLLEHGEELIFASVLGIRAFWIEHARKPPHSAGRNRRRSDARARRR
jgi:uncharacterized protein